MSSSREEPYQVPDGFSPLNCARVINDVFTETGRYVAVIETRVIPVEQYADFMIQLATQLALFDLKFLIAEQTSAATTIILEMLTSTRDT